MSEPHSKPNRLALQHQSPNYKAAGTKLKCCLVSSAILIAAQQQKRLTSKPNILTSLLSGAWVKLGRFVSAPWNQFENIFTAILIMNAPHSLPPQTQAVKFHSFFHRSVSTDCQYFILYSSIKQRCLVHIQVPNKQTFQFLGNILILFFFFFFCDYISTKS